MENQLIGPLTILICAIIYFISWKNHKKDNYQIAVLLLLISGFILRIYTASDFFLHSWDERYHALVAKHLMEHPLLPTLYENHVLPYDYTNWLGNHVWVHKQPLPLWCMAASMKLFGTNEIALRIPSILLTTIGILLTFKIASYLFNKKVAFIAAFLYSINGLIIELTAGRVATDHIDIFFLFFVELCIYFAICLTKSKKSIYTLLAAISLAAALLSKWLPALIVLPISLLLLIDSKNFTVKEIILHAILLLVVTTCLVLPWQLYIFEYFPKEAAWEASFNFKHITEELDGRGAPFYYFFNKIRVNYGEIVYLPFFWFLWQIMKQPKNLKLISVGIWFLIPFLFFSAVKTKMQGYILFAAPALFLMIAAFYNFLIQYKEGKKWNWFYTLILILLIALPIRYSIERIKPFTKLDRSPQWAENFKSLNKDQIENGVLFNCNRPIEAMFYTDLTVYNGIPDSTTLNDLIARNYTLLIVDDGDLSDIIRNNTSIRKIKL